jgi:hypothetical protein
MRKKLEDELSLFSITKVRKYMSENRLFIIRIPIELIVNSNMLKTIESKLTGSYRTMNEENSNAVTHEMLLYGNHMHWMATSLINHLFRSFSALISWTNNEACSVLIDIMHSPVHTRNK